MAKLEILSAVGFCLTWESPLSLPCGLSREHHVDQKTDEQEMPPDVSIHTELGLVVKGKQSQQLSGPSPSTNPSRWGTQGQ